MTDIEKFWKKYHQENFKPSYFINEIIQCAKILNCKSVFEFGCGFGINLSKFPREINCMGVDISAYAINEGKKKFPDIKLIVGDIENLTINEKFDLVYTSAVLEHLPYKDVKKKMQKLFDISKKFILNIEAYDNTEHSINWHRGKGMFWTLHMAKRWKNFPVKVLADYDINDEYRFTLICKI